MQSLIEPYCAEYKPGIIKRYTPTAFGFRFRFYGV